MEAQILPFRGIANFRDLGGSPAADGRRVKKGLIFRSGGPIVLDAPEDRALFQSLGVKTVLDLRSAGEQEALPDCLPDGVAYLRISAMYHEDGSELDFSPAGMKKLAVQRPACHEDIMAALSKMYSRMPFHNPAFQTLFDLLGERKTPLLFHCSAGKDRTGTAAMLVLLALGVSTQAVLEDYMLTNRCLGEGTVFREPAEAVLSAITKGYGSYTSFFQKEYGLSQDKLDSLQSIYLQ